MIALRKYITCFLLLLAALPFLFSFYFRVSERIIHHDMREELERNHLVTVRVDASSVTWTKAGKEAIVNGKMFDVKNFTTANGQIELVGLFDEGEDILMSQLDSQEEDRLPATGHALVLKWFSCFSWVHQTDLNYLLLEEKSSSIASLHKDFITDTFQDCETPPPEIASI